MRCSTMDASRIITYHADNLRCDGTAALQKQIVRYVAGIRGKRQSPVTEAQILRWFRGTEPDFIRAQLTALCIAGRIRICQRSLSSRRRANGGYVYEIAA